MLELLDGGCTVFLEVGPGRTLTTSGRVQADGDTVWLPGLAPRTPDPVTVLTHLARLDRAGTRVDWAEYHAPLRTAKAAAPLYPFARTRHWTAPPAAPSVTAPVEPPAKKAAAAKKTATKTPADKPPADKTTTAKKTPAKKTPAKKAAATPTVAELRQQAKAKGVKGYSTMTKAKLLDALS